MLNEIVTWWRQQMLDLLPDAAVQWADRWANALVIERAAGTVVLLRRRRGVEARLGSFALDESGLAGLQRLLRGKKLPLLLRLAPDALLEKRLTLPLQAERELGTVLRYEMDRVTPFGAGDLFWGSTLERRDRARGRLHVRLFLVPRAELAPLLERLGRSAIAPDALEAPAAGSARPVIPLEPAGQQRAAWRGGKAAEVCCVALGVSAIVLPFIMQGVALAHVEGRIAALQPAVTEVEALRRRVTASTPGGNAIAAERERIGDPLGALAAVTATLPDNTFLTDLSLAQRHLTITGQSGEAARIIPALAAEPGIRDPVFAAPVTRSATNSSDLFSIRAEIAP